MRIERHPGGCDSPALGAIFGMVGVATLGLFLTWIHLGFPEPVCHFHTLTGIPCPTCGSVRMIESLLAGQVTTAFGWNPLVFTALLAIALWAALSTLRLLLGLPLWRLILEHREKAAFRLLVAALVTANWIYLIRHGV